MIQAKSCSVNLPKNAQSLFAFIENIKACPKCLIFNSLNSIPLSCHYIFVNFLKIFKHLHASLSTNRLCRTILDTPSTTHTALLALLAIFFLLKIISALFDSSGKENSFPIFLVSFFRVFCIIQDEVILPDSLKHFFL